MYYFTMARNILDRGVFGIGSELSFFRTPGYPAFLAAILLFPGDWRMNVAIVQSAITIGAAVYTFISMRDSHRVLGTALALILVVAPFEIYFDFALSAESLYRNLTLIIMMFAYHHLYRLNCINGVLVGVLLACLILVRQTFFLFPLALAAAIVLLRGRKAIGFVCVSLMVCGLTLQPWYLRNATSPNGGYFLSRGVLPKLLWTGTWFKGGTDLPGGWLTSNFRGNPLLVYDPGLPDGDFPDYAFDSNKEKKEVIEAIEKSDDEKIKQIAIARILRSPTKVFLTWLQRSPYMWTGSRIQRHMLHFRDNQMLWKAFTASMFFLNIFIVVLGTAGMLISLILNDSTRFFITPVVYTYAVYLPLYNTEPRYSSGVLCFLYLFNLVALLYLCARRRNNRRVSGALCDRVAE